MDTTTIVEEGHAGAYAEQLLEELIAHQESNTATVLALRGDLGAGKTTLVQSLASLLGVTEIVTSPTFVVMKTYTTTHLVFTNLVHIDAYRIDDESELNPLNFKDVLKSPHTLVCIEWPERIARALPEAINNILLTAHPDGTRSIIYHGH